MTLRPITRDQFITAVATGMAAADEDGMHSIALAKLSKVGAFAKEAAVGSYGDDADYALENVPDMCKCPATQAGLRSSDPGVAKFAIAYDEAIMDIVGGFVTSVEVVG